MRKFDRVLIISITPSSALDKVIMRASYSSEKINIIQIGFENNKLNRLKHEDIEKFKLLTSSSCIFIDGHSSAGSSTLSNDDQNRVQFRCLAYMFKKFISPKTANGLTVKLYACHGSDNSDSDFSFAYKFSKALYDLRLRGIHVIGYSNVLYIRQLPLVNTIITTYGPEDLTRSRLNQLTKQSNLYETTRSETLKLWIDYLRDLNFSSLELHLNHLVFQLPYTQLSCLEDQRYLKDQIVRINKYITPQTKIDSLTLRISFYFGSIFMLHLQDLQNQLHEFHHQLKSQSQQYKHLYLWNHNRLNRKSYSKETENHLRSNNLFSK